MPRRRFTLIITPAGIIFSGITLFVFIAAINSGTNLLFFAFGLMLAALAVSGMVSAIMLRKVQVERLTADHAVVSQPNEIQYHITNGKRKWPSFALRLTESRVQGQLSHFPDGYCLHLGPQEAGTVMARLSAAQRGVVQLNDCRVSCAFPFGFIRCAVHLPHPQRIVVYPRIGTLSRELGLRYRQAAKVGGEGNGLRGGHDEFYGLREYRAGDNVRAIHWRRTARTGELLIREMTSDAPPQVIIALDLRAWQNATPDMPSLERAIELTATLVCHGFLQNFAVGLLLPGAANAPLAEPRTGRDVRARMLEALATLDLSTATEPPARVPRHRASEIHWVLVTAKKSDDTAGIIPPGGNFTLLALDQPGSENWVQFDSAPLTAAADEAPRPATLPVTPNKL